MINYQCKNCQKTMVGYKSNPRKFCSRKCMGEFWSGPKNPNANPDLIDKKFCSCGAVKDYRAKKCSKCSNKSMPVGNKSSLQISKEILDTINSSTTITEVSEKLGHARSTISKLIIRNNIDVSHFQRSSYRPSTAEAILVKHNRTTRNNQNVKALVLRENLLDYVCSGCGQGPEWNNKPLTLDLDHINGDWQDDRLENLRFLCPNCHSQTDTWKGAKTKGLKKKKT